MLGAILKKNNSKKDLRWNGEEGIYSTDFV